MSLENKLHSKLQCVSSTDLMVHNKHIAPSVSIGDILSSDSSQYLVLERMGTGGCGQIFKCRNMITNDLVVLKLPTTEAAIFGTQEEIRYLRKLSSLGHPNMIKFLEDFEYKGYPCVVLEILHMDLYDLVERSNDRIHLSKIRAIAKQIFTALDALNHVNILHADVKPDNIMLTNSKGLKVKLIDFGMAYQDSEVIQGIVVQPVPYRAPEVLLGLPFSYGIDTWGMGCVLMYLYLEENLFTVCSEYKMMSQVVQLLGQPEDHLLREGLYTKKYFVEVEGSDGPTWRLKTPEEYNLGATEKISEKMSGGVEDPPHRSLDDLVNIHKLTSSAEFEDQLQFLDLIKSLLKTDAAKRISASEALNHPFITMSHLLNSDFKCYLNNSTQMMRCCNEMDQADDEHHDDGNEELHLEEQQAYESVNTVHSLEMEISPQSGDGNHHAESLKWEHLEGVQCRQPEKRKSELVYSTQGTSLTKTCFPNQTSLPPAALHTGLDMRTFPPNMEAPTMCSETPESSCLTWLWSEFKAVFNCCFFPQD